MLPVLASAAAVFRPSTVTRGVAESCC